MSNFIRSGWKFSNASQPFRNYQPEEYEDDDDGEGELDDEAMEALLEAEFEDGTKGQTIVDPDSLEDLIKIDPNHLLDAHMAQGP